MFELSRTQQRRDKMSTDKATEDNAPAPLLGLGLSEGLGPAGETR